MSSWRSGKSSFPPCKKIFLGISREYSESPSPTSFFSLSSESPLCKYSFACLTGKTTQPVASLSFSFLFVVPENLEWFFTILKGWKQIKRRIFHDT